MTNKQYEKAVKKLSLDFEPTKLSLAAIPTLTNRYAIYYVDKEQKQVITIFEDFEEHVFLSPEIEVPFIITKLSNEITMFSNLVGVSR